MVCTEAACAYDDDSDVWDDEDLVAELGAEVEAAGSGGGCLTDADRASLAWLEYETLHANFFERMYPAPATVDHYRSLMGASGSTRAERLQRDYVVMKDGGAPALDGGDGENDGGSDGGSDGESDGKTGSPHHDDEL